MVTLRPLTDTIGTEVLGVDIGKPIPSGVFDRIFDAWIRTTILLFRDQSLSPAQQIAFTRCFGDVAVYTRSEFSHPEHAEILILSNIQKDGKLIGSPVSGRVWHSDGHYLREPPAASLLYAIEVPPLGGDTWFANMYAAYESLPSKVKTLLEGRNVIISRVQSRPYNYPSRPPVTQKERAAWPDMVQPLVRTHPVSGRKALYVGGNVPWRIEGMQEHESAPLISALQVFAVQPEFTYIHAWRPGDLIVWDNRSAMHHATAYDAANHRRLMHRTTVSGDRPF